VKRLAALVAALSALALPAIAHAAPPIARPNPALVGIRLDYVNALPPPSTLAPLGPRVTVSANDDKDFLRFRYVGDLGGFMPAPVGTALITGGGRNVHWYVGGRRPLPTTAPDNGRHPVPGIGFPVPPPPPNPADTPPPANQGFGGRPGGGGGTMTTVTTTTTRRRPPSTTTTTTTTTTTSASTTTTTTTATPPGGAVTSSSGGGGGGPVSGTCGIPGIQIDSNPPGCVVSIGNAAPGDSVSEVMTITNTSGTTYTLALRAEDANHDHLWSDLQMGVYPQFTPPPSPLPPLSYWTAQFNDLTILAPGQTVTYVVVLYLPTTAGNADQGLSAVIGFHWRATG
jgi:hypothetical protein